MRLRYHLVVGRFGLTGCGELVVVDSVRSVSLLALGTASGLELAFGVDGGVGRTGGGVWARCWCPCGVMGLLMAVNPMGVDAVRRRWSMKGKVSRMTRHKSLVS